MTLAEQLQLPIHTLATILNIEWNRGSQWVPYTGYVEVHDLQVPAVQSFDSDVLLLVVSNGHYGDRVPIVMGTLHIDMLLEVASEAELKALGKSLQQGELANKIAMKQAQLSHSVKTLEVDSG